MHVHESLDDTKTIFKKLIKYTCRFKKKLYKHVVTGEINVHMAQEQVGQQLDAHPKLLLEEGVKVQEQQLQLM
jgi:hypothetical protein